MQGALEVYFRSAGFNLMTDGQVDLLCSHPITGESWHVEAKGHTTQVGLDFRTGIGQLIQSMRHPETKHGIAVPDTPAFRAQVAKVSDWVVALLRLHWFFVGQDGSVRVIAPSGA